VSWGLDGVENELLEFTRQLIEIFHSNPVLHRRKFFRGRPTTPEGTKDVYWIRPDGQEMADADWSNADNHVLGMLISGEAGGETDERGEPIAGDTLLLLLNGGNQPKHFSLPATKAEGLWTELINTARPATARTHRGGGLNLLAHSLILLRRSDRDESKDQSTG
jgi:glycogen operon protein